MEQIFNELTVISFLIAVLAIMSYVVLNVYFFVRKKSSKRNGQTAKSKYFRVEGLTDPGKVRKNNEDSFLILRNKLSRSQELLIFAVADGMGGENYGEVASSTTTAVLWEEFNKLGKQPRTEHDWGEWLKTVVNKANLAVIKESGRLNTVGSMGTTLVAALVDGSKAYVINVGDSRAYLMRDHGLSQITKDHSLVSIMAEKGLITREKIYTHPRRGELISFIGRDWEVELDLFEVDLQVGDTIMLCSDGLWEMVRDPAIAAVLSGCRTAEEACKSLLDNANRAGGSDNITVVVIKVEDYR